MLKRIADALNIIGFTIFILDLILFIVGLILIIWDLINADLLFQVVGSLGLLLILFVFLSGLIDSYKR